MKLFQGTALIAAACAQLPAAQARNASDYSAQELVEALVLQRFEKVLRSGPYRDAPPKGEALVLLEGKALSYASEIQSVPGMRVVTLQQLQAELRSNFIIISQLGKQGADMLVDYYMPQSASYGTLRLQDQDGKLVFQSVHGYRSSSGSRATYARLFGGLPCRDGSDMAYRFAYTGRSSGGKCPVATFPSSDSPFEW